MFHVASRCILAVLSVAVLVAFPLQAVDAAYPEQLIKIIVTFPPGGSADIVIRALEPLVTAELKQSLVIENRAGAGGNIGMAAVAQAKPDGYTLGIAPAGALTVNPHLNSSMPFDPKDLAPITLLAEIPFVLVSSADIPAHNVAEAIALAKAKPGALSIGHGGNSTAMHLTAALFTQKAGIDMELVPYRGTAPATVDVLAGHVPFAVLDIPASMQLILDGKLNAIGVSSARRVPSLPKVPTLAESGIAGFESVGWFGLVAPSGTPPGIVARLNEAFVKALKDPSVAEKIRTLGAEPAPTSPEEFGRFIQSESTKWGKLISEAGIKAN
ncbi:tripartite tricarboxylate transporter substrate binding protein [Bradyrhizobium diazoefficiens]|uniref:Bug family tripartite tricarboxylate transporter substrate binding protein n=1 Tax=Bradyrhizobium diazoefficiens TaxID=1355477 RepID=UPI00190E4AEB|nr:tripartite tricarboxylate transporter substrate binding protein [Bradyrhizobium diazoefficiens]QQO34644.1 tripartite tricarboxylate transporter substrate binding protein [Bradyrhizobium diazoefficiens]